MLLWWSCDDHVICRYKIFAQTVGDVDTTLPQVLRELGE